MASYPPAAVASGSRFFVGRTACGGPPRPTSAARCRASRSAGSSGNAKLMVGSATSYVRWNSADHGRRFERPEIGFRLDQGHRAVGQTHDGRPARAFFRVGRVAAGSGVGASGGGGQASFRSWRMRGLPIGIPHPMTAPPAPPASSGCRSEPPARRRQTRRAGSPPGRGGDAALAAPEPLVNGSSPTGRGSPSPLPALDRQGAVHPRAGEMRAAAARTQRRRTRSGPSLLDLLSPVGVRRCGRIPDLG